MKLDEVEIHVEGSGPPIVMIHGWPDSYRLWDAQVAALKGAHRCIRFSLPGFERGQARRTQTLDELSAFIVRVCDTAAPGEKVTLLLHDWGCAIGYQFYLRNPQRVARIIGVDIGDTDSLRRESPPWVFFAVISYQVWLALSWMIPGELGHWMNRFMAARLRRPADNSGLHSGMAYPYFMTWFGGPDNWRRHMRPFFPEVPMLYIYARRKPFMFHAPSWIEKLKSRAGNQVIEFDTGHWVMLADPQGFNRAVSAWLARPPAPAAAPG